MKTIISTVFGCLALSTLLSFRALAVVPYPETMAEGGRLSQEGVANSTSPGSASQIAEKLAQDQRRLESVLQDLKEDQKAFEKQANSKESQDGHDLH